MAKKRPWIIAHRGFSALYPENTVAAFDAAMDVPVDGIELDIQMTSDRVSVIYHDKTLLKVGGGLRKIRNRTLDQLAEINPGHAFPEVPPQNLPLLEEILSRYGQRTLLLLEIKRRESDRDRFRLVMDQLIGQICAHRLEQRAMILCYDLDLLIYGHQQHSGLRFVLNQDKADPPPGTDFLYAWSINISGLTPEFANQVHQAGKQLLVFTCDTEPQLKKALKCEADGIMANNPQWLSDQLSFLTGEPA